MKPTPGPIRFLFDFVSPYSYLAWTQIHALAARHSREVEPVPVLFAALLDAWGSRGPAEIAPKRTYFFKDVLRSARVLDVPLVPPPAHPFNPLLALRAASLPVAPEVRRRFIDGLYAATWGGGPGVTDPATVSAIARASGLDGDAVVRDAQSSEAKQRVRHQTDAAIELGAWGVPTLVIGDELFWGFDSFAHIDRFLRGDDTIEPADLARWADVPLGATRKKARDEAP